ncbi:alpha-L-glutamate ligase-like protein [Pseudohalioglobus sediminis]|uniref:Alpha-L-glutamate ligase-like protein n=1 Tax=Pseudohalioglobus sediminis TaxID=2606449 RepID=A0A5B0WZN1_9GAMM|nr:alpha-L-glutamate ligase-like protein [Pseudohalioglobus sediminis]KAA1192544.1 alpha-L-glutamate ligase-like protein [Pseudohalioglobus sediminis]
MISLASPAALRRRGIMGMNERNVGYIGRYNPRRNYPLVDNKLKTKQAAGDLGIAVPALHGVVQYQHQVRKVTTMLEGLDGFVIKPAQGSGGKGILVVVGRHGDRYIKSSGQEIEADEVRRHVSNVLAGLHSLGGRNDVAMIEALIDFDPELAEYSYEGVPDLRVIAFRGVPVMAMMRCATHDSDGKANLHQGAVGVGLDIGSGRAVRAVQHGQLVERHPDTGAEFASLVIPHWGQVLDLAARCVEMTGLQYLGADVVLDKHRGPMLLELNARPGLAIQVANQAGLRHRLVVAAQIAEQTDDHDTRIALARKYFAG